MLTSERGGSLGGALVELGIGYDDGAAGLEIVDVAAVVAEVQNPGQGRDAGRVPVALDRDGLARPVDRTVTGAAHAQQAAEDLGGGKGDAVGILDLAQLVSELGQRGVAQLRVAAGRDVEALAEDAADLAQLVVDRRVDEGQHARLGREVGPALETDVDAFRFVGLAGRVDLVEQLEEPLAFDARESLADRLALPIVAGEDALVRIVDEFDDMLGAAHDDDEAGRLFEQALLTILRRLALAVVKHHFGRLGAKHHDTADRARILDWTVAVCPVNILERAVPDDRHFLIFAEHGAPSG
jgi:hypothetical protein